MYLLELVNIIIGFELQKIVGTISCIDHLFLGHTQQELGITPGSALRGCSWLVLENHMGSWGLDLDQCSLKASDLPFIVLLFQPLSGFIFNRH